MNQPFRSTLNLGSASTILALTTEVEEERRRRTAPMSPRMKALAKSLDAKWRAGQPLFREAALWRELATEEMWGSFRADWFSEFVAHPLVDRNELAKRGVNPQDMHLFYMAWAASRLRAVSDTSNWFRPTEALTYLLMATDLKGAVAGDIKLPMPAFYIEFPPETLYLEDPTTGWHEIRHFCIVQGEVTENTARISREFGEDVTNIVYGKRLVIEAFGAPNAQSNNPLDDAWLFETYPIGEDELPLDDMVHKFIAQDVEAKKRNRARLGKSNIITGADIRELMLRFVLNFCIYVNTGTSTIKHIHEDEIKHLLGDKKRKNLRKNIQERIHRLENDRVFEVGTEVQITKELKELVLNEGTGGMQLSYRTLVRGHWRNQAHGPGRMQRTRKWIEPHVRGNELPTKTVGHTYEVT